MTPRIGHLLPGEELTDAETFLAVHSTLPAAPEDRRPASQARVSGRAGLGDRSPGGHPAAACSEPSDREERSGGPPPPPSSPAAAAALEAEIECSASREHVARLAVHLARAYAPAVALFVVHRGVIEGLCSEGVASPAEGLLFPADAPSLFAEVVTSGEPVRGAPPRGALDERILRVLGRRQVQEIAVLPVAIRGRVVNLLYADNGPEALPDASVAALAAVCARVSTAYQRLILERKRGSTGDTPASS